jgi:hypothetical protein
MQKELLSLCFNHSMFIKKTQSFAPHFYSFPIPFMEQFPLRLLLLSILHLLVGLLGGLLCGTLVGHPLCGFGSGLGLGVGLPLLLVSLALLLGLGLSLGAALVLFRLAALVEALDDGGGGAAELLVLADVLGLSGVLAVLVEPVLRKLLVCCLSYRLREFKKAYLKSLALGLDLLLLLLRSEIGVPVLLIGLVNLVTEGVDVTLEFVLLVFGLGNELVLALHAALLLEVLLTHLGAEGSGAGRNGKVALADLLLDLAGLGSLLVVGLTLLVFGNGLLNLLVLDVVTLLDVEHTVKVKASLELADHEVTSLGRLDALDAEAADPRVDLAGKGLGLSVPGLEVEVLLAVEGQDLGGGHGVALVKDSERCVLIRDLGGFLPGELDGVGNDILNAEVANAEDRGEDSAAERAATGNSLVSVQSVRNGLALEQVANGLLEGRHTRGTTNKLDHVNVLSLELGVSKSLLNRSGGLGKQGCDELLELLTFQESGNVNVVHDHLDVDRGRGVGGQDLLQLLNGSLDTDTGLVVGVDINLVLLLPDLAEVVHDGQVEVATTEVPVGGGTNDLKLALLELGDGSGVVAVANVDEGDSPGLLLSAGKVELCDTPAKSSSGGLVDQTEDLDAGNLSGVEDAPPLCVGVPGRARQHQVVDGESELGGSGLLGPDEEHGNKLCRGELLLLALELDARANLAILLDKRD